MRDGACRDGCSPCRGCSTPSTIIFLLALPTLWKDWWRTSRYTRLFTLTGASGTQQVVFSFHRDGHYHLQLRWSDGSGPLMLGEPGTYAGDCRTSLLLTSHDGGARRIDSAANGHVVSDAGGAGHAQLNGWHLSDCDPKPR
ncbi:hypothetical protein LP420_27030 [Massilia sp. B-10]|nr:hypothetical protein LP420_27030 [Massilia sp. B-10]